MRWRQPSNDEAGASATAEYHTEKYSPERTTERLNTVAVRRKVVRIDRGRVGMCGDVMYLKAGKDGDLKAVVRV